MTASSACLAGKESCRARRCVASVQLSLEQVTSYFAFATSGDFSMCCLCCRTNTCKEDLLTIKGTGMGLGGLALALLGARVVLTDTAEVLPMLTSNYERNLSPAALRSSGSALVGAVGAVEVN